MKRLMIILSLLLFLGNVMANERKTYFFNAQIHNMHCSIRLNGILLFTTVASYDHPANLSLGYSVSQMILNGENKLTIEANDVIDYLKLSNLQRKEAYCNATLREYSDNNEIELVTLKARYSDEEQDEKNSTDNPRIKFDYIDHNHSQHFLEVLDASPFIDKDKGIYIAELSGSIKTNINFPAQFSWRHADYYADTPENKQRLWEKYNELRVLLDLDDDRELRAFFEPGLTELAQFEGSSPDSNFRYNKDAILSQFIGVKSTSWSRNSIDSYEIRHYADGKLFQLVEKNEPIQSPIKLISELSLNPMFTYIDGEIVVAWF